MVNLFIRSFAKIDDVKMEYSVQITFRQKWSDDRLTYKHRLTGDMQSELLFPCHPPTTIISDFAWFAAILSLPRITISIWPSLQVFACLFAIYEEILNTARWVPLCEKRQLQNAVDCRL